MPPLTWIGETKHTQQGHDAYELHLRSDCNCEYRFWDGKLKELRNERDPVAENLAIRQAEIDTVRNRRCPTCGGPLDDWLAERKATDTD